MIKMEMNLPRVTIEADSTDFQKLAAEMIAGIHSFWAMLNDRDPEMADDFRELMRQTAEDDEIWDPHFASVDTIVEVDSPEELMED